MAEIGFFFASLPFGVVAFTAIFCAVGRAKKSQERSSWDDEIARQVRQVGMPGGYDAFKRGEKWNV